MPALNERRHCFVNCCFTCQEEELNTFLAEKPGKLAQPKESIKKKKVGIKLVSLFAYVVWGKKIKSAYSARKKVETQFKETSELFSIGRKNWIKEIYDDIKAASHRLV